MTTNSPGVLRVLVVDDEPLGQQRVLELLETADVEVVGTATDGVQAVESIRRLRPDVVFLDVQMPRMSGLEVVRAVGAKQMPVTVFVTAFDQYAIKAFDLAAIDYLVKPFSMRELVARVAGDGTREHRLTHVGPPGRCGSPQPGSRVRAGQRRATAGP